MIFDVKMDLTRKARFVAGGHQTDPPKESTYSSVVLRDSVRMKFLIAALNSLDILLADVQNAYLNAPTKEKVYTTAGPKFGAVNKGCFVLLSEPCTVSSPVVPGGGTTWQQRREMAAMLAASRILMFG